MLITNQRIQYCIVLAILKTLLLSNNTLAQTSQTIKQKVFDLDQEIYLSPKSDRLEIDLLNYAPNSNNFNFDNLPDSFQVPQIKVVGNSVFSTAELLALVGLDAKQTLSKSDLRQIIQQLNQAYRDRGYVTSGIFSAPKLQPNGKITLTVIEGKIEQVNITGLNRLRASYIRNRIVRDPQQILNQEQLNQALQLLKVNHLIKTISAKVLPGSSNGNSVLELEVEEDDHFYVELGLDNVGNISYGSFRRQIEINYDNVLGFGDRFYTAYTNSDGSNALNNLSYIFPVNAHDGTIGVSYGIGKLELINPPFDIIDLDLEFSTLQLNLRQPLYQTEKQEFALGLSFSRIAAETSLLDVSFPLIRGAESDGELNISAISFYQDYTKRGTKDRLDMISEISVGVDLFDATDNNESPDSHFFIWRGDVAYQRQLTNDLNLSLKSFFQLSDRPLSFLKQTPRRLFIEGREEESFFVRGYLRDSLVADNGVFASAELQADVWEIDRLNSIIQLIPFVDFGTAWNEDDDLELAESTLISVGLGLRLLVNDNFRARLDWGIPLIELDFDSGSLQEDGITFNIEYRPL
ncbi:MAG: ShlB/FhaC/HecB family hemolysin secretion/activation protein [Cyanobacteria bacterium P01_E01_bin.35]